MRLKHKKAIIPVVLFVVCACLIGILSYEWGYESAVKEDYAKKVQYEADTLGVEEFAAKVQQEADKAQATNMIGKVDYPLLDIGFNDGNDWTVVIATEIYTNSPDLLVCADGRNLQYNKEYLSILTYPAGRGTTGNGCVEIYKNGELHQYIEFFDYYFADEGMKNYFEKMSKEKLQKLLEE